MMISRSSQRKYAIVLVILLLSGGVVYHLRAPDASSVIIGYSSSPVDASLIIASSHDFWSKHDVHPKMNSYSVGRLCLDAVIAGTADIGTVADTPFVYAIMRGHELEILATLVETNEHVRCVASAKSGVLTPADLKGKRLAVFLGTASEYLMSRLLARHHIAVEDVTLVNMPPAEMVAAFSTGQVDAAFPFEPFTTAILAKNGKGASVLDTKGLYTMTFNLVARRGYGEKNSAIVQRVLASLIDADAYIDAHPVAASEEVAMQLKLPTDSVKAYWGAYRHRVALDASLLAVLNEQQRWIAARDTSLTRPTVDFQKTIQPAPLAVTAPAAVALPTP